MDTATTTCLAKTMSNSTNSSGLSNGFDETSEFVTAASSLATGEGIQDWLGGDSHGAASSTSKRQERPKWTLHTESELHIQRLEAVLAGLNRRKQTPRKKSSTQAEHLDFDPEPQDLDSQEILDGQEESDEGLWLLWNNPPQQTASSPQSLTSSGPVKTTAPSAHPPMVQYGSMSVQQSEAREDEESPRDNEERAREEEREAREERLDQARQKVKHVDQYTRDTRCCAVCPSGCIIS